MFILPSIQGQVHVNVWYVHANIHGTLNTLGNGFLLIHMSQNNHFQFFFY